MHGSHRGWRKKNKVGAGFWRLWNNWIIYVMYGTIKNCNITDILANKTGWRWLLKGEEGSGLGTRNPQKSYEPVAILGIDKRANRK